MPFNLPLEVSFKSSIVGGKFYTLDEEKEVTAPYYSKQINSVQDLTPIEIKYILIKYSVYNKNLSKLAIFIDKMKI